MSDSPAGKGDDDRLKAGEFLARQQNFDKIDMTIKRKDEEHKMKLSVIAMMFYGDKFLIGRAANHTRWDIIKGQEDDPHDTFVKTAIREAEEESGIELLPTQIIYKYGPFSYVKNKNLFLCVFKLTKEQFEQELYCKSEYEVEGKMIPELIEYKWVTWEEKDEYLYHSLVNSLRDFIDYDEIKTKLFGF